ncbi:MAG: hypothetical protein KKE02_11310 [Alphaproteobacteria bacterium]|nr:hypothetical protein [Alphaproteobacteria bacterium]MBU1512493.1 hypothetical protein [Alphaproteobacteria bacterium]MBU2096583.1 hypothetical protein [Alphaproteobacteria bacterium]MBU2151599.1 hypothetical protein [Alphaproteobacteria bacterium]MBU2307317.1 hypothetical protein [Alphaproteobacteria bacterium]
MGWRDLIAGLRAASAAKRALIALELEAAAAAMRPAIPNPAVPSPSALQEVGSATTGFAADRPETTTPPERGADAERPEACTGETDEVVDRPPAVSGSISLLELVNRSATSHGLALSAGMYPVFEITTVREFLDGTPSRAKLLGLLGFGITKYEELHRLCVAYLEDKALPARIGSGVEGIEGATAPDELDAEVEAEDTGPSSFETAEAAAHKTPPPIEPAAGRASDVSSMSEGPTLADLADARGSVRLRNCMKAMPLAAQPISAFRNDVRDRRAFLSIPGFGQTTYDELASLVGQYRRRLKAGGEDFLEVSSPDDLATDAVDASDGLLSTTTLATLIRTSRASTRLSNMIHRTRLFDEHSVADMIAGRLTEAEILRVQDLGRTTFRELGVLVESFARDVMAGRLPMAEPAARTPDEPEALERHVLDGMTVADLADHADLPVRIANRVALVPALRSYPLSALAVDPAAAIRTLSGIDGLGRTSVAALADLVSRLALEASTPRAPAFDGTEGTEEAPLDGGSSAVDPQASVNAAIAALNERHQSVLGWRYGLAGDPPLTLQDVADRVHVTRERVRQVEKKALRILSHRPWRTAFERLLAERGTEAWTIVAAGDGLVPSDELGPRIRKLFPLLQLAVDVVHGGPGAWLDAFATPAPGGWLPPGGSASDMRDAADRLRRALEGRPLPQTFAVVCRDAGLEPAIAGPAMSLVAGVRVHEGYVHSGYLGPKARRAARMHALAVSTGAPVFDVWRLAELDAAAAHDDERSPRMIAMQLDENPHLFHRLFDQVWAVLPAATRWPGHPDALPPLADAALNISFEPGSLSAWLHDVLEREGPQRHVDLRDRALKAMPGISGASVGPILLSHPVFVRAAPGVYALRSERYVSVSAALLSTGQARTYSRALRSGVTRSQFAAWTGPFEWRLCEWAKRSSEDDVFRSLLSVATPSEWPAPETVKSEWLRLQETHARWALSSGRDAALGSDPPTPAHLLSGLLHLALLGSIGWIGAGRVTQSRLGSQGSADLLAVLVACGAAECPEHWQDRHPATGLAGLLLKELAMAVSRDGDLSWSSPVPAAILADATENAHRVRWAEPAELAAFLSRLEGGPVVREEPEDAPALAEIDDLFASEEWESLFNT